MVDVQFDKYYRYAELTAILEAWAAQYPDLCRLEKIGVSYEGRNIWLMVVTNFATGSDTEKPAMWVDGNIHATEVSASTASLYLLNKLLTQYGQDDKVTYALDSRAFYVVPRLNPDGAEWALADTPKWIRSSTKPYPRTDQLDGLIQEDIDGNGRLLQMRLQDPHGAWKVHPDEPRLMVPREPDDPPGENYYRLLLEGRIQNYDGVMIKQAPSLQGLDLNRQFPVFWQPDQAGAGDYPGSEPESAAAMRFIADHPNITGGISYHTYSGVHLRPPTKGPETELPTQDLRTFKKIGKKGTEITGYPAISVYHDFAYDPKSYIRGTFDDWLYEHLGVYAWTTEIWSIQRAAGVDHSKVLEWFRDHPVEDDFKIFKWMDEELGGEGYVTWYEFDHPQLGKVELGGWDLFITIRNPPYKCLEKEVAPLADWAIFNCLISPKLEPFKVQVESHGDLHHILFAVHNTGWLPTNISEQAMKMKVVKPLEFDLILPEGAALVSGEKKVIAGQLRGRDDKIQTPTWGGDDTNERAKVEWVVKAPAGTEVELVATHKRAGVVRQRVILGD
ncbi:MAG: carboxypeptidase [Anaerolineae bacterium]|nr:carboxypeptidase [Anaerolineae bacterium]